MSRSETTCSPGGKIPTHGCISVTAWAQQMCVDVRTFRKYIVDYDIPFRKPGDEMYVDVEHFLECVPIQRHSTHGKKKK